MIKRWLISRGLLSAQCLCDVRPTSSTSRLPTQHSHSTKYFKDIRLNAVWSVGRQPVGITQQFWGIMWVVHIWASSVNISVHHFSIKFHIELHNSTHWTLDTDMSATVEKVIHLHIRGYKSLHWQQQNLHSAEIKRGDNERKLLSCGLWIHANTDILEAHI